MDAILFEVKRVQHGMLRFGHELLGEYGLTPARFDMLFAIREYRLFSSVDQRELRRLLGVARPTVSRMLRSLERLGLVRRDERRYTRRVYLTRRGLFVIRRASKRLFYGGFVQRAVQRIIRWRGCGNDFVQRDELDSILRTLRQRLGDTARLHYNWHPDD